MTTQAIAVALIVGAAVVYLVWKMFAAPGRPKKGPDVAVSRLKRHKGRDGSGAAP